MSVCGHTMSNQSRRCVRPGRKTQRVGTGSRVHCDQTVVGMSAGGSGSAARPSPPGPRPPPPRFRI
jgi:hypothetical protein